MTDNKTQFEDYLLLRQDLFKFYPRLKNPFEVTEYREAPNGNPEYIKMTYCANVRQITLEFFAFKVQDIAVPKFLRASKKWLKENALASVWLVDVKKGKSVYSYPELVSIYRTTKSGKPYVLPRFASMRNAEKIAKETYNIIKRGE